MPEPTTRAYTIKLTGNDDWRSHLWSTHVAVNRGAWAWGEWLLTLRGGLPASLADAHPERRILLALSWLSVESPASLVTAPIVARAGDNDRADEVLRAFRHVLSDQGVEDVNDWLATCEPALRACIRDDAVWVNRHAAFSELADSYHGLTADWAGRTLFDFLGGESDYFRMPDDETESTEAKDFVIKAGNWLSRNWGSGKKSDPENILESLETLAKVDGEEFVGSSGDTVVQKLLMELDGSAERNEEGLSPELRFKRLKGEIGWGTGRESAGALALKALALKTSVVAADWHRLIEKFATDCEKLRRKINGPRRLPSMPNIRAALEARIGMHYRIEKDFTYEFAVMLDHALRRVSSAHSWIKRAEVSRRQFHEDAAKPVNAGAKAWLDQFCEHRTIETGGQRDYVIHKRALDGWDKVVSVWNKLGDEASQQDRIAAARQMQSNLEEDEKLGDMTLFERIATDEARCVWLADDGKATSQILKDYSTAQVARHNQQRFKVPAYRHPDPLRNPIYVDFGNSRWSISYSALKTAHDRPKLRQKLAKAMTDATRAKLRAQLDESPDLRGVTLGLWTGERVEDVPLRWQGKRLWHDLDLDHFDQPGEATVSRADRLGRALRDVPQGSVTVAEVFNAKDWNGRLQAPREQLDRLADLVYGKTGGVRNSADYAKLEKLFDLPQAARQFDHLRWFLTTSAKLKPTGPWWKLVEAGLPSGIEYKKGRSGHYLNYEVNKGRKGRARLQLAGIPGLRILSFDLGHRYGATCAVWETLTQESLQAEITRRDVTSGSLEDSALYLHTLHIDEQGKTRRTIYRRTAADMWARLERQFVIKLQGEDRAARWALAEEMEGFSAFREFLGLASLAELGIQKMRINELQQEAIREARYGLRRLGDVARIAFSMTAKNKPLSGGRNSNDFTDEERIAYVAEALARWQQLARNGKARDDWAAEQWQRHIVDRLGADALAGHVDDVPTAARKRQLKESVLALMPIAENLVKQPNQAAELHKLWSQRYQDLEQTWRLHLRWLRRLVLPHKGEFKQGNVGGLSVQRLQTIRGLYETLRAFRMRPEPADLRKNVPAPGDESLAKFGRRILDRLEQLREQRIKQLASRIVEAALGAGRMRTTKGRDRKRPVVCVDKPCHAVVAENLERYKPEETRLRRENRRLMDWAARNVRKYIVESCELNGLHFEEVSAAYTSQQDSRTGAPGIRCEDIPIEVVRAAINGNTESLRSLKHKRQAEWLAGVIQKLPSDESECSPRQLVLRAVCGAHVNSLKNAVRLPKRGGELFVSASNSSPAAGGLQADLNAAANIGLKALMHPDYIGAWWYVLVDRKTGEPVRDQLKGCALWDDVGPLSDGQPTDDNSKSGKRTKDKVYAWNPFDGTAGHWKTTSDYKKGVDAKVAADLLRHQTKVDTPW